MFKRPLLKLSGESLGGEGEILSFEFLKRFSKEIREIREMGSEIALLPGGGNVFRGTKIELKGVERTRADYMGMLGTLINSLAIQDALEKEGLESKVFAPFFIPNMADVYEVEKVRKYLKIGVPIFALGTGSPFFTTDTAAALRALEIKADIFLKATRVSGIYDKDPERESSAIFFPSLTFDDVIKKGLRVMDLTSVTLCRENSLPIVVFDIKEEGNLKKAVMGEKIGTKVGGSYGQ